MKCDELKAFNSSRIYWAVEQVERVAGDIDTLHLDDSQFYLKSEADKEILKLKEENERLKATPEQIMKEVFDKCLIYPKEMVRLDDAYKLAVSLRKQKYKRCLAMAKWCKLEQERIELIECQDITDDDFNKLVKGFYKKWHKRWLELAEKFKDKEA